MSAAAGPLQLTWETRRLGFYAAVALSGVFLVLDSAAGILGGRRADLAIELLARALMLVLAVLAARETKGDLRLRLLLWAVVLVSFDTYWQSTYRYLGGKPIEWLELFVKYAAVPAGLALLLRLCVRFGNGMPDRLRGWLDRYAFPFGAVLALIGLVHGSLYVRSCYFFVPGRDQCLVSPAAVASLDAYLVADALLRLAIVAAAAISYVRASREYKHRTLLVVAASVVFALGTATHFVSRLYVGYDAAVLLALADAVTMLFFPLALLYASTRGKLFDVEFTVRRIVSAVLAALVLFAVWAAAGTSSLTVVFALACGMLGFGTFAQKALLGLLIWLVRVGVIAPKAVFGVVFVLLGLSKLAGTHLLAAAAAAGPRALAAAAPKMLAAAAAAPKMVAVVAGAPPQTVERYRSLIEFSMRDRKTMLVYLATVTLALIELVFHESMLIASQGALGKIGMIEKLAHIELVDVALVFLVILTWLTVHTLIEPGTAWFFPERPRRIRTLKRITDRLWERKDDDLKALKDLDNVEEVLRVTLSKDIWAVFAGIVHRDSYGDMKRWLLSDETKRNSLEVDHVALENFFSHFSRALSEKYEWEVCAICADAKLVVSMSGGDKPYGLLLCGEPKDDCFTFADDELRALEAFGAAAGAALLQFSSEPGKAGAS